MAKIMFGGPVANASGSMAGVVFSHNRYGSYTRRRTVPVKSETTYATNAKAKLAAASAAWKALTTDQRNAWVAWAKTNPIVDTLGEKRILDGHAAYVKLNNRLLQAGLSQITVPPVASAPVALTSLTLTADIGAGDFEIAFTPTPAPAGTSIWVEAAVVDSPGITYVTNLYKLVIISAAAQASPLDIQAEVTARFGTLTAGQKVFVRASVFNRSSGLLSQPALATALVTST